MIEIFQHIFHLDFKWLFDNYGTTVYVILFCVIFIETGLVIMPFLPGDSLLFTAGLFAHLGFMNIAFVIVLLFIAAVLGDNVNYFIGKKIGLKVLKLKMGGKNLVKPEYLDKTQSFYQKYGTKTIILARFVPIVRTFAPFVAGVAEMKYRRFVLFDLLGGGLWICSMALAGYLLSDVPVLGPWIQKNIDKVAILIILISILPIIFEFLKARRAKK